MAAVHSNRHFARGVLVTLLAGPPMLAGGATAVVALLGYVISGWTPSTWFSSSPADWAFGSGVEGDAGNFFRFMVGAVVASSCWSAIRWGFQGSE